MDRSSEGQQLKAKLLSVWPDLAYIYAATTAVSNHTHKNSSIADSQSSSCRRFSSGASVQSAEPGVYAHPWLLRAAAIGFSTPCSHCSLQWPRWWPPLGLSCRRRSTPRRAPPRSSPSRPPRGRPCCWTGARPGPCSGSTSTTASCRQVQFYVDRNARLGMRHVGPGVQIFVSTSRDEQGRSACYGALWRAPYLKSELKFFFLPPRCISSARARI